jgi:hypothetical protein
MMCSKPMFLILGWLALADGVLLASAPPTNSTPTNSAPANSAPAKPSVAGKIEDPELSEASGLAASRRQAGLFWTHNDSGNLARLYALDATGKPRGRVDVNTFNIDWEDIAIADDGMMFIADTGNNSRNRKIVTVYGLPEPELPPTPAAEPQVVTPTQTYRLRFPGKPQDFEALFVTPTHGYLLSKVWGGGTTLYRFARQPAANDSPPSTSPPSATPQVFEQTLEVVCDMKLAGAVTGASLSPGGKRLAIQTILGPAIYDMPQDPRDLANAIPRQARHADGSAEACAWDGDDLLIANERRTILRFTPGCFPAPAKP